MGLPLVFCGTPEFAVPSLIALHQSEEFDIRLVLSQPDRPSGRGQKLQPSPVKKKAIELGLNVLTPEKASADEMLATLAACGAQVGVVVAYGQILSQKFLDLFEHGCVNIHSSLLPRWRGAAPMQRAIMSGDRETGVSLQKVVRRLDAGPIIGEIKMELTDDIGTLELTQKLSEMGAGLLLSHLPKYVAGQVQLVDQDESQITYAAKIEKAEGQINWSDSADKIHNLVRGLNMGGPYASTRYRDKDLKIHRTKKVEVQGQTITPGSLIDVQDNGITVACGQGALELLVVQPESKARMNIADFVRGYRPQKGEYFQ